MKKYFTFQKFLKAIIFLLLLSFSNLIQAQSNCPDGMISYWKFDEAGGVSIFLDSFGGHTASCTDCPVEDSGLVNRARNFNGSSEVTVPDNNAFDWGANTSYSVEAWIKTTQPGTGNKVFVGKYRGGSNMSWWLGYGENNTAIFSVRDSGGVRSELEGKTEINDGNWHHIVGIRNNSLNLLQIFVDGDKENEQTTFFTGDFSGNGPLYIGYYINDFHFDGSLDEVAIYDTLLSEDLIADHYNNGLMGIEYCDLSTDIKDDKAVSDNYMLYQNYPNPFNPATKIGFQVSSASGGGFVSIVVYDVLGREAVILINEEKPAGKYEIELNAELHNLTSGVYFCRMHAGSFVETKKIILMK